MIHFPRNRAISAEKNCSTLLCLKIQLYTSKPICHICRNTSTKGNRVLWHVVMMALMTFFTAISSYWEGTRRVQVNVSWGLSLERLSPKLAAALLISISQARLPPGVPWHQELVAVAPFPPCSSRCTLKGVRILSQTPLSPLSPLSQRWVGPEVHQAPQAIPAATHLAPRAALSPDLHYLSGQLCAWLNKHSDNTVVLSFPHVRSLISNDAKTEDVDNPTPPERQGWRAYLLNLLFIPKMNRFPCSDLQM